MQTLFGLPAALLVLVAIGNGFDAGSVQPGELREPAHPPGRIVLEDGLVAMCTACHRGALSLAGQDPELLMRQIASIAASQGSHPVPVEALSETDLAELARRLAMN